MPPILANDLKARIPILFHDLELKVPEICRLLGVKKSLVYKTLGYFANYGVAYNPHAHRPGRPRILNAEDVKFVERWYEHRSCTYLDELQHELYMARGVYASIPTLCRTIQRLDLTRKKISAPALERNALHRSMFMNRMGREVPDPNCLVFLDEAARNRRTSSRPMGYSRSGVRCVSRRQFVRGDRVSILPAITLDGIIAYDIIEGSVTSARFVRFLRERVIPLTNPYPGPRSVIVMDNCSIHHSEEVRKLVEEDAQCKLFFLPPYSPDLNPIEQAFASIKAFLRRHWREDGFSVIIRACSQITPQKAWGFFKSSGYVV